MYRYLTAYALATLADLFYSVHVFSLGKCWIWLCLSAGFAIPFMHMLSSGWFADSPTWRERAILTACSAAGIVSGTGLTLWWFS